MTNEDKSSEKTASDKPATESAANAESPEAQAAKPKKLVRRSGSTREHPAFSANEEGAGPSGAEGEAAASAGPQRPRATLDMRAPRPAPSDARPPRPRTGEGRPGEGRPPRGRARGDFRAPEARPAGMRPVPGGPRAPARGDFRAPEARPAGMRPAPGGPRAPAETRRGERAPEARPQQPAQKPAQPAAAKPAQPAQKPAQPAAAKPAAPPPPAPKVAPIKPLPLRIATAKGAAAEAKPAPTAKEVLSAKAKAHAAKTKAAPAKPEGQAPKAAEAKTFEPELLNVGQEGALDALRRAGDDATALVDAWLGASNAAAIVAVAEADEAAGAARKAARRALNVLRSRGVAIPERAHVARLGDDRATVSLEATLTAPDAMGTIAMTITSRDGAGRYHLAEVIIREPLGVIQAGSGWLSGTQLKEGRSRTIEGLGVAPVTVPVEWARHRIASALKLNAASRYVVPLGLERCRELIEPVPEAEPSHPLADIEGSVTAESAQAAAKSSADLHAEPEFRTWMPERGALDELLQKLGERLGPDGARDPEQVGKALSEEMEAATDRFFSPEVRDIVAKRMRDAAISVRARKGAERAAYVLSVARAVREAGLITSPPREVGFLLAFFQKALGALAHQSGGQLRVPMSAAPSAPQAPEGEAAPE